MDCLDDQTVLDFAAGALEPGTVARVDAHLDHCAECRELVVALHHADQPRQRPVPQPGHRFGRFSLLEPLGAGAMGVVHAAYDPELDRRVALKVLSTDPADPKTRARLVREAQAMAKVSHPNVVTIYDVGTAGDLVFIAMELVQGDTLRVWAQAQARSWSVVRDVCLQAGRGLAAAHAVGLVHRDYKPDNVIVGQDRTRVGDFGLATANTSPTTVSLDGGADVSASLTQTGALVGTPAYMAPEQLRGEPTDARSDQFSYCAATFEALCGVRPFAGDDLDALGRAIEAGRVAVPASVSVPRWLIGTLDRGMSLTPDARFASMDALLAAMQRDRVRRTSVQIGGVSALVLATSWGAYTLGAANDALPIDEDPCAAVGDAIDAVWSRTHAAALRDAFATQQPRYGATVAEATVVALDRWATQWAQARVEVCRGPEATESQVALRTARQRCLAAHQHDLDALVTVLVEPTGDVVAHARDAVAELPAIAACGDVQVLRAVVPVPEVAEVAADVAAIRAEAAVARVHLRTGSVEHAKIRADALLSRASRTEYGPLIAEVGLIVAAAARRSGALNAARGSAQEALWAAQQSRHDRVVAQAWIALLQIASAQGEYARARLVGRHALAAVQRLGSDASLSAPLHNALGIVLDNLGRADEAQAALQRALALRTEQYGPSSTEVARVLTNLGNLARSRGALPEALARHREALAIDLAQLGQAHPNIGSHRHNLGRILLLTGKRDEALASYLQALSIKRAAYGDDHVEVARTHNSLGLLYAADGQFDAATASYQRALTIYTEREHADESLVRHNLALLLTRGGDPQGALAQLDTAATLLQTHGGAQSRRYAAVLVARGDAQRKRGRVAKARRDLQDAQALAEQLRDDVLLQQAQDGLAALGKVAPPPSKRSGFAGDAPSVARPGRAGLGGSAAVDDVAPPPLGLGAYAPGPGVDDLSD